MAAASMGPVTWRCLAAVLSGSGVDEPAPDWPKCGQSPGRSMAAVAAAHDGGGGGKERDGMVTTCDVRDLSTAVA